MVTRFDMGNMEADQLGEWVSFDDYKNLANEKREIELLWESVMMRLLGADGLGSVEIEILKLQSENERLKRMIKPPIPAADKFRYLSGDPERCIHDVLHSKPCSYCALRVPF